MDNMLSWNWPNWITVVLMVALGYLVISLASQLVRGRLGLKAAHAPGGGQTRSQQNFAGIFGQTEFDMAA